MQRWGFWRQVGLVNDDDDVYLWRNYLQYFWNILTPCITYTLLSPFSHPLTPSLSFPLTLPLTILIPTENKADKEAIHQGKRQLIDVESLARKTQDEVDRLSRLLNEITTSKSLVEKDLGSMKEKAAQDQLELTALQKQLGDAQSLSRKDADEITGLKKRGGELEKKLKQQEETVAAMELEIRELKVRP